MSQSPSDLIRNALESKVQATESESRESPESGESSGSQESTTITRSELESIVREGVQEGLSEYERETGRLEAGLRDADDDSGTDTSQSDDSSSGGSAGRILLLLGLIVAAVIYRRRQSANGDGSPNY